MSAARIASAFAAAVLLAACAAPGFAGGLTLRWGSCVNGGGVQNRSFACDVNTGTHLLVASFEPQSALIGFPPQSVAVFDVATAGATLPAWWTQTCRPGSTSLLPAPNDLGASCELVPFPINSGLTFVSSLHGPTTLRMIVTLSNSGSIQTYSPGHEYSLLKLAWNNQRTVGTGSCEGCSTPACIVFNSFDLRWGGSADHILSGAAFAPGSDAATWQGGGGVTSAIGIGCPAATPVRRAVWGSVKALYR